jgi:uncharacterized protein YndB with AHSA1/START domain
MDMQNINVLAPVQCSKSMLIDATPEKVWAILTDIDRWGEWNPEISQPQLAGSLVSGATFTWKTGGTKIHSTLHTVVAPHQLGWTGKTFGIYAIHNWTIGVQGSKTIVAVEESMEGLLARLLKKSFNKNLATGMGNWLEALKVKCER